MISTGRPLKASSSHAGTVAELTGGALPRGLRGLLAISFLTARRGTITGYAIGLTCVGAWIACLTTGAPPALVLFTALVLLPSGLLVVPVVGVLQGQRLPADYRQLEAGTQLRLWLRRTPGRVAWLLPAGALTDATFRPHLAGIAARAEQIAPLARGARAALAGELREALRGVYEPATADLRIEEAIARVQRWEEAAAGLPPIGAKLYLRHDPLSKRAAEARQAAARLGVPSDKLNYFWPGQVLLLPPVRSARTLAALIDTLLAVGVADADRPLPLQLTIQGGLGDDAKLIALVQLLASGLDLTIEGPERRGDEGNLIARGRRAPEPLTGSGSRERSDFLFGLIWSTVPRMVESGHGEQHHHDARVVQTLSAALLAANVPPAERGVQEARLAAIWLGFAEGVLQLSARWGVAEAVQQRYLDVPFAGVRPALERLLARKAAAPGLQRETRRLRDATVGLIEFTLAVQRLTAGGGLKRVHLARISEPAGRAFRLPGGVRRARQAIRRGARVAVLARSGDTLRILLDGAREGEAAHGNEAHPTA